MQCLPISLGRIIIVGQRSEEGFVREAERLRASYLSALAESFTLRLNSSFLGKSDRRLCL